MLVLHGGSMNNPDWIAHIDFEIKREWLDTSWLYYYNMQYCLFGG